MSRISETLVIGLILLLIALVYFVNLPVGYDFDGTVFSHFLRYALVENNLSLVIQSHHLLYFPLNFVLYKTLNHIFGYQVLEYFHLQLFSLFFSILTLAVCARIVRKIVPDLFFSVMTVLLIAASYGFWYYSVEAEVHMAALFFVVSGIYVLFFRKFTPLNMLVSAWLLSMAAGFHLTHGLILFSVLLFFILEKKTLFRIGSFYLAYALFFVLPYLVYYIFSHLDFFSHFRTMLFGENPFAGYRITRWQGVSPLGLAESFKSVGASFFTPESGIALFLFLILLLALGFFLLAGKKQPVDRPVVFKFLSWMLPYFIFFTVWEPHNPEFKTIMIIPFWMIFVYAACRLHRPVIVRSLLTGLLALLAGFNFFASVKPRNDLGANRNYQLSVAIRTETPENSTVVIAGSGPQAYIHGKIYIPYFSLRNIWILDWKLGKGYSLEQLSREIRSSLNQGRHVFFLSEVLRDSGPIGEILRRHAIDPKEFREFLRDIEWSPRIGLIDGWYMKEVLDIRNHQKADSRSGRPLK